MSNYENGEPAQETPEAQNNGQVELTDAGEIQSTWDQVHETFDDMELHTKLVRGIYGYGFEKPSSIQQRAIVPIIKGRDVIAQAQSGTGKTATFAISTLQSIDTSLKAVQALILAPTRELANQIIKVLTALGDYMEASCYACIGGTNVRNEIKMLKEGNISVDDITYHLGGNYTGNIISTMIWDLIWENDRQKHRIIELDPEVDQKTKLRSMLKQKTKHLDKEAV